MFALIFQQISESVALLVQGFFLLKFFIGVCLGLVDLMQLSLKIDQYETDTEWRTTRVDRFIAWFGSCPHGVGPHT